MSRFHLSLFRLRELFSVVSERQTAGFIQQHEKGGVSYRQERERRMRMMSSNDGTKVARPDAIFREMSIESRD